jgi:hypothetical protein
MTKRRLLAAGTVLFFIFAGCSDPALSVVRFPRDDTPEDSPSSDSPFKEVSYLVQLIDALEDDTTNKIRIADNITLSGILEIPEQKTLEIMQQKTLTINDEITVSGVISIMDDADMWIKSKITFAPASQFNVAPRGRVIAGGEIDAHGKIALRGQISLENTAKLIVDENLVVDGDITVGSGAQLIAGKGVLGGVNGTITVLNGGLIRDQASEGTWIRNKEGAGSIILKYGSVAYIGNNEPPAIGPLADASLLMLTSTASEVTLTGNGYLLEGGAVINGNFTLEKGESLWLRNGAFRTSASEKNFIIEEGASFFIEDQAVFEMAGKTSGKLEGKVEVRRGGKFINNKGGGSLFSSGGNGSLVVYTGAVVQQNDSSNNPVEIIGTNGTKVQLESGRIEIKNSRTYLLDGNAKLVGNVSVSNLGLTPSSVLIVDAGRTLTTSSGLSSITGGSDGDTASRIVLVSDSSVIADNSSTIIKGPKILTFQYVGQWQ